MAVSSEHVQLGSIGEMTFLIREAPARVTTTAWA